MRGYVKSIPILGCLAVLVGSHVATAESVVACPPSIETAQTTSDTAPEGWSSYGTTGSQPFVGVSFFLGPPERNMLLAPSREQRTGKKLLASWTFPPSDTGYWVACEYAKTTVLLVRRIRPDPTTCTVDYDASFSSPIARS